MKLTKAQERLLRQMPKYAAVHGAVTWALCRKGLIGRRAKANNDIHWGHPVRDHFDLTDAGRKWLEQNPEAKA